MRRPNCSVRASPTAVTALKDGTGLAGYDPGKVDASYMITAFEVRPEAIPLLRAALHQGDKTARPQILTREANPEFYLLIEHFRELTGVGAILNTSFNLRGEPIVATPEDAVRCLMESGLDLLVIGRTLVRRTEQSPGLRTGYSSRLADD